MAQLSIPAPQLAVEVSDLLLSIFLPLVLLWAVLVARNSCILPMDLAGRPAPPTFAVHLPPSVAVHTVVDLGRSTCRAVYSFFVACDVRDGSSVHEKLRMKDRLQRARSGSAVVDIVRREHGRRGLLRKQRRGRRWKLLQRLTQRRSWMLP
jgi:hypothetical protein